MFVRITLSNGHTHEFENVTGIEEAAGNWLVINGGKHIELARFTRDYVLFYTIHESR